MPEIKVRSFIHIYVWHIQSVISVCASCSLNALVEFACFSSVMGCCWLVTGTVSGFRNLIQLSPSCTLSNSAKISNKPTHKGCGYPSLWMHDICSGRAYSFLCWACCLHIQTLWATSASILWAKVMHIHFCRLGHCVAMRLICCQCSSCWCWTIRERNYGLMKRSILYTVFCTSDNSSITHQKHCSRVKEWIVVHFPPCCIFSDLLTPLAWTPSYLVQLNLSHTGYPEITRPNAVTAFSG